MHAQNDSAGAVDCPACDLAGRKAYWSTKFSCDILTPHRYRLAIARLAFTKSRPASPAAAPAPSSGANNRTDHALLDWLGRRVGAAFEPGAAALREMADYNICLRGVSSV